MNEQLISFETAKLAKEKGLTYNNVGQSYRPDGRFTYGRNDDLFYPAPTQSLLQKWLREKHNIHIVVNPTIEMHWTFGLINLGNENIKLNGPIVYNNHDYNTYEEALEIGLQEALKLI